MVALQIELMDVALGLDVDVVGGEWTDYSDSVVESVLLD